MDNLSPEIAAKFAAARERAVAQGRVDVAGATRRTVEATAYYNRLHAWHAAGKPAADLAVLKAEERALRKAGLL